MKIISLFLYNLGIRVYTMFIWIAAFRNKKARLWVEGRRDIFEKIASKLKADEKRIWIHCASLGEFEQGRPLIEMLKQRQPEIKIVLTFFSPSGYEIRKNYAQADYIFYLPADTAKNAKKFLALVKPVIIVFVKYEFWYNYFLSAEKNKIPLLVISTIFRKNQVFFKWYGGMFRRMLNAVTHFFVQDEASVHYLRKLNLGNSTIIPDTRIDRVAEINRDQQNIPVIENFINGKKAIIGGSVYIAECRFLKSALHNGLIQQKLVLAPHNINDENIRDIKNIFGDDAVLFSESNKDISQYKVLIVNKMGLLSSIYKYGNFAIIGGGFGHSIHNILEPAAFGLPVIFGPNYQKFKEAHELLASGGAFTINNFEELRVILQNFNNKEQLEIAGFTCKNYIKQRTGGTEIIYNWILQMSYLK